MRSGCRLRRVGALLAVVGLVGLVGLVGCGAFSETAAPAPAEAGAATGTDGDSGAPPSDSGVPGIDASPTCFDLTTGSHGFVAFNETGATFSSDDAGLRLHFPEQDAGCVAAWQRTVDLPASATGARLTIEAVITMPTAQLPTDFWYAGLATLVNGKPADGDTVSSVHMLLGEGSATNAAVSMETFLNGTSRSPGDKKFLGPLPGGTSAVAATLDVTWSTMPGANLRGVLSPEPEQTLNAAPTLVGARSRIVGLSLGGAAMGSPDLGILYTKVCYAFH